MERSLASQIDMKGMHTGILGRQKFSHVHINLDDSSHPLPLTTVYRHLQPVHVTPYTIFQAIFGRGYPVDLLDEEKILAPGRQITAIGYLHLTENRQPGIKSCKSLPYFLTYLTKDQLELAQIYRVLETSEAGSATEGGIKYFKQS